MQRMDERVKEILEKLKETDGYDYRYDHFSQSEAVPPPFLVYRRVAADPFSADGVVYHHGQHVDVELYASTPDEMSELMAAVEELFDAADIYYKLTADTVYIESEDFYESLYEI